MKSMGTWSRAVVEQFLLETECHGRCRPAHAVLSGHALDGLRGGFVELEVLVQIRGPEDWNVGLVPDLEVPLADFVFPVPFAKVERQVTDQRRPFLVGFWRSDVALPPEDSLCSAGQIPRHEPQLDKRPQSGV